MTEDKHLLPCA